MHSPTHHRLELLAVAVERGAQRERLDAVTLESVRRVVDQAPPLTPEQRERIALLLWSGDVASRGGGGRLDPGR